MSLLIDLIEIFLGAFNNWFTPEDSNYLWFSQIIVVGVCLTMLVTSCICLCIIVHDILKYLGTWGNRR